MAILAGEAEKVNSPGEGPGASTLYLRNRNKLPQGVNAFISKWLEIGDRSRRNSTEIVSILKARGKVAEAVRLAECGSYLWFREYFTEETTKLLSAQFCRQEKLCIFCAARRAGKMAAKYIEKYEDTLAANPHLQLYNTVLTIRDDVNLVERFDVLNSSFKVLWKRGKKVRERKGSGLAAFSSVLGGTRSIEVKRGRGSGLWHPHIHALLFVDGKLDKGEVVREWAECVGQTFEDTVGAQYVEPVDLRVRRGDEEQEESTVGAFLECFKYAMKFSEMSIEDLVYGFVALKGRRFLQSYGCIYGMPEVEFEDSLMDDASLPFVDWFFRHGAEGYSLKDR